MASTSLSSSKLEALHATSKATNAEMSMHHEEKQACCDHLDEDYHDDAREQVGALLGCLDILVKLAKMDTADYQASLQKGPWDSSSTNKSNDSSICQLQKSLEDIQRRWKLEDTPILQLTTAIHRFHSTINNLQHDAEEHTVLYNNLAQQVQQYQKRNAKLEHALTKVCAKNEKLTAKIKHRNQEKQSMMNQVKAYVQQVKDAKKEQKEMEEQKVAYQLHAHQHFLQQHQQPLRARSVSADLPLRSMASSPRASPTRTASAARRRVMSQDAKSIYELDAPPDFDQAGNPIVLEGLEDYDNDDGRHHYHDHSGSGGDDSSVFSSTSSVSSLITDEGVATVRFGIPRSGGGSGDFSPLRGSPKGTNTTTRLRTNSKDSGDKPSFWGSTTCWPSSSKTKPPPIITLTFPNASTIGLQFEKAKVATTELQKPPSLQRPKGLLTDDFLKSKDDDDDVDDKPIIYVNNKVAQEQKHTESSGFQLKWNNVFGKSSAVSTSADVATSTSSSANILPVSASAPNESTMEEAFVVSSFQGFNDELNDRPSLGARLVAVSGEPVDANWSLADLQEQIQKAELGKLPLPAFDAGAASNEEKSSLKPKLHDNRVVTLSFREDHLEKTRKIQSEKANKESTQSQIAAQDGVAPDISVSSKLASSFNFLKKTQAQGNLATPKVSSAEKHHGEGMNATMIKMSSLFSTKSSKVQDSGALSAQKQATDSKISEEEEANSRSSNLIEDASNVSVLPKMSSLFSTKSSLKQEATAPEDAKLTVTSQTDEQEEEINLDTHSSSEDSTTVANEGKSFLGTKPKSSEPGEGTPERQVHEQGDMHKDAKVDLQPGSKGLFLFLSPEKLVGTPGGVRKEEFPAPSEIENAENEELGPSEKDAQKEIVTSEVCQDSEDVVQKSSELVAGTHPMPACVSGDNGDCQEEAPTMQDKEPPLECTEENDQKASAGDKFRSSMMSMGKMFSNPFSQAPQKLDSQDSML